MSRLIACALFASMPLVLLRLSVPARDGNMPTPAVARVAAFRMPLERIAPGKLVSLSDGARLWTFDISPHLDRTLVFVHGDAVTADFWLPQVEYFRGRFRIVLYDRAECGRSSVGRQPLTYSSSAKELAELLDKLRVGEHVLVGHSRGQEIAATYFASRPRGLRGFIASGTALQPAPTEDCKANARRLVGSAGARAALVQGACTDFTRHVDWLGAPMHLSDAEARALALLWCKQWRPQEGILACTDVDISRALAEINVPMLQIDGGAYRKGVDRRLAMQRWYRDGRLVLIEGAEHAPSLSHPEQFNRAMVSFLRSLQW